MFYNMQMYTKFFELHLSSRKNLKIIRFLPIIHKNRHINHAYRFYMIRLADTRYIELPALVIATGAGIAFTNQSSII